MKNIKQIISDKTKNPKTKTIHNNDRNVEIDRTGSIMLEHIILLSEQVNKTNSIVKKLDLIAEQNTYLGALTKIAYLD